MASERPYQRERRWALVACLLIVVLYFLAPVEPGTTGPRAAVRGIATALGVLVVSRIVLIQIRRQMGQPDHGDVVSVIRLGVALVAGLMMFALADYVIATSSPGEFVAMETKVDALYFALTTLTTVGYGDVHAAGQFARAAVCAQLLFSIGVLATGASILFKQLAGLPPPPPPSRGR